jgi:hypothetical protein
MSEEIAMENIELGSYPYLMQYQIIGYSQRTKDIFGNYSKSPSLTIFHEVPVDLKFSIQVYASPAFGPGWGWAEDHCLGIKAPYWPSPYYMKNDECFATARFDFRSSPSVNSGVSAVGGQAVQPAMPTARNLSSGFSIYLKDVGLRTWVDAYDPFFDSNTILFAYRHVQCWGNVPRHLHPIHGHWWNQ